MFRRSLARAGRRREPELLKQPLAADEDAVAL
jgi:hypothetical protein